LAVRLKYAGINIDKIQIEKTMKSFSIKL